ncbi:Pectinacetylesterase family protein [Hibiscus syriacus]|uniref:Pectinacetylesterase family protein n=1 Tax=Hibiscus syriacus TaxID=106335 RepID=A0A6A2ZPM0_HIBSY|nr:Pectinacetylesterase family protein [Hibiscus syriacus]
MASNGSMTIVASMLEQGFDDIDVVFDHDDSQGRTDACPSVIPDDGHDHLAHPHNLSRLSMCTSSMSRLSIESFDADAEVDEDFFNKEESLQLPSDSDKESGCYSLPTTPLRWRNPTRAAIAHQLMGVVKDYASENEDLKKDGDFMVGYSNYSGESQGGSAGVVVITRPRGGKRSLCMDFE